MKTTASWQPSLSWPVIVLLLVSCLPKAQASALDDREFQPDLRASAQALEAGDYQKALDLARKVADQTAEISDPGLLEGMALNRLGRFSEAADILTRAANSKRPEFAFELGWAFVGTARYQEAVLALNSYEALHPGRAMTCQLLGQAYLGLGNKDKAYHYLQLAEHRDATLKPVSELYLATVDGESGRPEMEKERLNTLMETSPSIFRIESPSSWFWQPDAQLKNWHVALSIGGGYDTNAVAQSNGTTLPTGISHKDGGFFYSALNAHYDLKLSSEDFLRTGYVFESRTYGNTLGAFNYLDNYVYANYRHIFDDRWEMGLLTSGQFTDVGDHTLDGAPAARPSVSYKETSWAATDLGYSFVHNGYGRNAGIGPILDRRDTVNSILLQQRVRIPGTQLEVRGGYSHAWDSAKGTDYSNQSDSVFLSVIYNLPCNTLAEFYYDHDWVTYHRLNSFTGFTFKRRDDLDSINLYLSHPITPHLDAFFRYNYIYESSNVTFFTYGESLFTSGLTYNF